MLNVLIIDNDKYYLNGMRLLIKNSFKRIYGMDTCFSYDFSKRNVENADVIILPFHAGYNSICIPALRFRRKGIIIGIIDDSASLSPKATCFKDIVYVSRTDSLPMVTTTILVTWFESLTNTSPCFNHPCNFCEFKRLTKQQLKILGRLCKGESVYYIARVLNLNYKTVYYHKYKLMSTFKLRSDFELMLFYNELINNEDYCSATKMFSCI